MCWGKGGVSDSCFSFQPQRLSGRQFLCALCATRCSSSDQNRPSQPAGPVLPDVGPVPPHGWWEHRPCCWGPRSLGCQLGITLPEDTCTCCSPCQCGRGGRPDLLAARHLPQLSGRGAILPTSGPTSISWMGAEQPRGSVPTFLSTVLGDCIFGIKSELCLHPQEMSLVLTQLSSASSRPSCAPQPHRIQV